MMAHIRETLANFIFPEGQVERRSLQRLVDIDEITQMGNRRAFERALPAAERDPHLMVVIFDLNNLGLTNKRVGHQEGDARIEWAAEVITMVSNALAGGDRCFRIGGDEFAVIIGADLAGKLIENVEQIHGVIDYDGFEVSIAGSAGFTFAHADAKLQGHKADVKRLCARAA